MRLHPLKKIEVLWQMLSTRHFRSVIWSRSGRSIVIRHPGLFRTATGPFFGFDSLEEFKNFLVSHGFKRVPQSQQSKYHNRFFQRDRRDLLHRIEETGETDAEKSLSQNEIDEMRKNCSFMMQEIIGMRGEYRRNEKMLVDLRDLVFSLVSHMTVQNGYHSQYGRRYNACNEDKFGYEMLEWEARHRRENRRASLGFVEELELRRAFEHKEDQEDIEVVSMGIRCDAENEFQ